MSTTPSVADRLTRVRELLSDLDGRYGNGELHTRAVPGEAGGLSVTPHIFDAVVIGVGGGVIATVLTWDDD